MLDWLIRFIKSWDTRMRVAVVSPVVVGLVALSVGLATGAFDRGGGTPQPSEAVSTSVPPTMTTSATATPTPSPSPSVIFVSAREGWKNSEIAVHSSEIITITASGSARLNADGTTFGPDGDQSCKEGRANTPGTFPDPLTGPEGTPCWSLIGRIGSGQPFFVGTHFSEPVPSDGYLFLRLNDDNVEDNFDPMNPDDVTGFNVGRVPGLL